MYVLRHDYLLLYSQERILCIYPFHEKYSFYLCITVELALKLMEINCNAAIQYSKSCFKLQCEMKYKIVVFIIHFRIQLYCIGSVMYNVLDSSVVDSLFDHHSAK
jgi:hypothetical protein